jgi:type IV secretion system protein VirB4
LIGSKRRHFHNLKTSLATHLNASAPTTPTDRLIDSGAVALVDSLGACLEEMEIHGRLFGQFSLTVVLYGPDAAALQRSVSQCFKVFATQDAQLTEERYNRFNAWLAVLAGNSAYNLRRLWLSNANYADLSFLYTIDGGQARNEHLGAEYLAVLEGTGGIPYFFNLHHEDVAHTLVLGATGSGKSFLLNFLLTHLQKYRLFTYIFDLGGSYKTLTRLFEGSYLSLGTSERSFTINPLSLPRTPENLLFLFAFVRVLIESNGYRLSAEDERDLYEQIENLYSVAPDQRRLFTLSNILRRNLRAPLQKWVQGGPYAALFDNAEDNLSFARFQTFDFEGTDKTPDQLEPLLFYILHRANALICSAEHATVFKVFVMDEAWRFFRHPVIKAYITEALKTWRRKEAAMILATQSSEDLVGSDMLAIAVESCPTKLFLANPGMDRQVYRDAFHLNETEADLIATLIPKQQILVKQPQGSRRVELNVDRKGYWLYTNNSRDNERKREAFARYGLHEGLDHLARGNA